MKRDSEKGQALLLVVAAIGIVLVGAFGLAIDGSQLYAHRQMAQAAADAAALAGISSVFNGTNVSTNSTYFATTASFTCSTTSAATPCQYARSNGFGGTTADTVTVDFPGSVTGVGNVSTFAAVNLLRVTVQRSVPTSLIHFFGPSSTNVRAVAVAAIVDTVSPVPVLVTHPTLASAFTTNGGSSGDALTICGGPTRSVQVNSNASVSVLSAANAGINLTHAGPLDPGNCTTGTGADFSNVGGPTSYSNLIFGSVGRYAQPAIILPDPLASVPQPAVPTTAGVITTISSAATTRYGCPTGSTCKLYQPGRYASGITVQNEFALFAPGLYYISSGGFNMNSNSQAIMATGFSADPNTGSGMVVFNTGNGNGDIFSFTSNAGANAPGIVLQGSDATSIYKGILFLEDRTAGPHIGSGSNKAHSINGGGTLSLIGTIYVTNTLAIMKATPTQYQALNIQGNGSSATAIQGEIIASALSIGGTAGVKMNLNANSTLRVSQIALVQ